MIPSLMLCAVGRIPLRTVNALITGSCEYVTLHGKKKFAVEIKVKALKIGRRA